MTRAEISAWVIINLVDQMGALPDDITEETDFRDDLGMDSLDQVEAILEAEKHFNICIPDAEANEIRTVKQLIDQVEKLIPTKS